MCGYRASLTVGLQAPWCADSGLFWGLADLAVVESWRGLLTGLTLLLALYFMQKSKSLAQEKRLHAF